MSTDQNKFKKIVRVTIETEVEVELTPIFFAQLSEAEFLAEWRKSLWEVESMDDVIKHAAVMAVSYGSGVTHDGLGLVSSIHMTQPRIPDVRFREISEEIESEILP